jgi:sulfate adenylyltransferase
MDSSHPAQTLLASPQRAEMIKADSLKFKSFTLDPRQLCDLELLLTRAYAPLAGFMGQEDFESVLEAMRLADGTLWPLPVSLDVPDALAEKLEIGEKLALRDGEGFMLAVLTVGSLFKVDPVRAARAIFATDEVQSHPGAVAYMSDAKPYKAGGQLEGLALPGHCDYTELRLTPAGSRAALAQRGWRKVLGCQAEPFANRGDKAALLDAAQQAGASILMLHPAGDAMAPGAQYFTSVRCAKRFAETLPQATLQLGLLPYWPLGAGPRQALLEALIHQNHGCTHFLVAPDHADPMAAAGEAPLYPLGAAQRLVADFAGQTGIAMAPKRPMVYVEERAQYVPADLVAQGQTVKTLAPGELRRRLEFDLEIPEWFMSPEIAAELRQAFPPRSRQGITLFMTGLSGAGKSTLAKLLYVKFMELRTRPVTLLDGDIVRRHLSSELTFSKAHRNLNIERIGYVASEITKNGGIAICAPIAPYASARNHARELVSRFGGFVEIHVATPLAVCEQRDRKGLYAKARAGVVKGVTGIDDPYETPEHAEIVLDTSTLSPGAAVQEVLLYLEREGYLT